jgi:hypothetical protein
MGTRAGRIGARSVRNGHASVETAHVLRSFVLASFALFAAGLIAAAPAPSLLGKPSVIVYPFLTSGSSIDSEASSRLATIIATQIAQNGDVSIMPPKPGIARSDFLKEARAAGADYYVTGFASPLGSGVSLVEQVVSTVNGIVVYSNTAQVANYAEAGAQGSILRSGILAHAARNLGSYSVGDPAPSKASGPSGAAAGGAPPAASAPNGGSAPGANSAANTPAGQGVNDNNVRALFSHKKPAASPSPAPPPVTPATAAPATSPTP